MTASDDLSPAHYPAEPPAVDLDAVAARSELATLIARTADTYASDHDHVVVLDDVVAEAIAAAVWDRYLRGAG